MKQCPVCKTAYTDDSLQFCLADGATLSFSTSEQPTEQFSAAINPIRVNIAKDEIPTIVAKQSPQNPPPVEKSRGGMIIGVLAALLLLVVLASAGVIGWLLLKDKNEVVVSNTQPSPTVANSATKTPTPDESAILKEKIANLEKKVQEQKPQKPQVPTISNSSTPQSTKITAKANSPGDGFLALRSGPSSETGERILQIPHGATITVLGCLPKAAGKKGRWCRVDYNGNLGWAFDGYMIYQ
jgi:hypothetical protein